MTHDGQGEKRVFSAPIMTQQNIAELFGKMLKYLEDFRMILCQIRSGVDITEPVFTAYVQSTEGAMGFIHELNAELDDSRAPLHCEVWVDSKRIKEIERILPLKRKSG